MAPPSSYHADISMPGAGFEQRHVSSSPIDASKSPLSRADIACLRCRSLSLPLLLSAIEISSFFKLRNCLPTLLNLGRNLSVSYAGRQFLNRFGPLAGSFYDPRSLYAY